MGNFGGFAKVRPKPNTFTEVTKREKHIYAVGYVTNAITSGHYVRTRKTFAQERGYITGRVEGKHFYAHTQEQAGPVAQETAEEIVAALLEFLEGD